MIRMIAAGIAMALLLPADASLADFASGSAAYQAGDYRAAYDAWHDAALSDDPRAQQGLGRLFESGSGVPQSIFTAYVWYQIADFHLDVDLTAKLAALRADLTAPELEEAERTAYAQSIEILAGKFAPPQQRSEPKVEPWGYTWLGCDCSHTPVEGGAGIGSKFTF
jgi:TPR repeat protein